MDWKSVSIIIQARSTSKRFPGKIFEKIGTKQILQHVLDACQNSSSYIIVCSVSLAVPYNDVLIGSYQRHKIIQGPEDDVLKRYKMAADELRSDYVVRITSDCPFIPPYIISRAINIAVQDKLDYLTNADPRYRTAPDGHDVEVLSRRMLDWLDETAPSGAHREHVTTYLHEHLPQWAAKADIIGFFKNDKKLSVDTQEDIDRLRAEYQDLYYKVRTSPKSYRL
jgi:spore coat polysaccharide biosynthesis protein SpsF (cytidylyltransferase family)